jgi:hypothetical protein
MMNPAEHIAQAIVDLINSKPQSPSKEEIRFALADRLCEASDAIWSKPVRTWEGLVERTAMAVHWSMPTTLDEPPYPDSVIADPSSDFEQRALAHVVRGILDLAGVKFDADGRIA